MPLARGYSKAAVRGNIKAEIAAGKKPAQAVAIAYRVADEARKKRRGK